MDDIKLMNIVDIELNSGNLHRRWLNHSIGTGDAKANCFGVRLFRDGEAVSLTGGSVQGFFRNSHGENIAITSGNKISGNVAYVVLPQACYNYEGQFTLAIKVINSSAGVTGTMRIVDGVVNNTNTGNAVAPTGTVPTYQEVLSVYNEMLAAKEGSVRFDEAQSLTAARKKQARLNIDAASLEGTIAQPYSESEVYDVGTYCSYNGVLYRCTTAITTAETWTASHWTAAVLGNDLRDKTSAEAAAREEADNDLKSAINVSIFDPISEDVSWEIGTEDRTQDWSGGGMTNNSNANVTKFVDISAYKFIRYMAFCSTASTTSAGIAFFSEKSGSAYISGVKAYENASALTMAEQEALVPTGAKYARFTVLKNYTGFYIKGYTTIPTNVVQFSEQQLTEEEKAVARKNINASENFIVEEKVSGYTKQQSKFWDVSSTVAVLTDISDPLWGAYTPIPVSAGETYRVKGKQGLSHKTRIWTVVDSAYNILAMATDYYDDAYSWHEETFTVPANGAFLLCTASQGAVMELFKILNGYEKIRDIVITPLNGKKLSLLGDSISAYAGTIPSGNEAYYTGSNSGVSSPDQMWWKVLCDKTGMVPLIINGWSGSGVNWQTDSAHTNKVPMSDDSRCNGLHDGSTTPDIILIAGGVNDYTYAQDAQNEPLAWDGKSVPGYTEPTTGKKVYNSFTEAYVAMIKKLQTNYPNAIVVALSTWFTMRGTDNGYILTHTVGQNVYTQQNYNDKIRYVAEQMHIPFIDVSDIGFNRNNFYPTYAVDSSTIPTHPNAAGHAVMGKAIAEKIIELVSGYLT